MSDPKIVVGVSENLKNRVKQYSESNEISQSGAVRMILNQNLPEVEG